MSSWDEVERLAAEATCYAKEQDRQAAATQSREAQAQRSADELVAAVDRLVVQYYEAMRRARKLLRNWFPMSDQSKYSWDEGVIESAGLPKAGIAVSSSGSWWFRSDRMGTFNCIVTKKGQRNLVIYDGEYSGSDVSKINKHREEIKTTVLALLVSLCKQNGITVPFR